MTMWNKIILIVLVISLVLGAVAVTYATYTNSQRAQRTIAAYDAGGVLFSSNYMKNGYSRDNVHTIYVSAAGIPAAATVTVCNYQQGKQTRYNDNDVTYTLTAQLVKYDDDTESATYGTYVPVTDAYLSENSYTAAYVNDSWTGYWATVKKGTDERTLSGSSLLSTTFGDYTLSNDAAHSDSFTLTFSSNFNSNPNLYVEMIARPEDNSLPTLRSIFKTGVRAEGISNAWTGYFADSTSNAPNAYDGFNYTVQGTGGGTFTLKWDSSKVQLSDVSIRDLLSITGATKVGDSITFPVNSDVSPRYDLQFYKVNVAGMTWADMNETLGASSSSLTSGKAVGWNFAQ